jgi:hypothetical protein
MWPEGAQHITETTKRPITAGTNFKNSIIALVDNLATKVGIFTPNSCPTSFYVWLKKN